MSKEIKWGPEKILDIVCLIDDVLRFSGTEEVTANVKEHKEEGMPESYELDFFVQQNMSTKPSLLGMFHIQFDIIYNHLSNMYDFTYLDIEYDLDGTVFTFKTSNEKEIIPFKPVLKQMNRYIKYSR